MSEHTLLVTIVAKAWVEIALAAAIGRGTVGLLAGDLRERNPMYWFFSVVLQPWHRLVRRFTPAAVDDRHVPWIAVLLLVICWLLLLVAKAIAVRP